MVLQHPLVILVCAERPGALLLIFFYFNGLSVYLFLLFSDHGFGVCLCLDIDIWVVQLFLSTFLAWT